MTITEKVNGDITLIASAKKNIWDEIFKSCERAKSSIFFEQYILHDDKNGQRFLKLLAGKAKDGVEVNLLLDKFGSREVYNSELIQEIREHGGHVTFYNNISWLNLVMPWTWIPRNHNKLFIIDEETVIITGACMADEQANWFDIAAKIDGKTMQALEFEKPACRKTKIGKGKKSDLRNLSYKISEPDFLQKSPIYKAFLQKLDSVETHIHMITPYFMPPEKLKHALIRAAKRGVDIKLIYTGKADIPYVNLVSQSYFPRLIKHGIRIYKYKGDMLHAKCAIIDNCWAMLGSSNLDYLSLLRNREGNLLTEDKEIIDAVDRIFADTLENCTELKEDFWHKEPVYKRFIGYFGRAFKKFL